MQGFQSLTNQGILPLSADNAYLGTNLMLAHEAEKSPFLYNFLNSRGAPRALEVVESGSSVEIRMFYPAQNEMYVASPENRGETCEWIVRGPLAPTREQYRRTRGINELVPGEPLFELWGKTTRFGKQDPQFEKTTEKILVPVIMPTPVPTHTPKPVKRRIITGPAVAQKTPEVAPENFDQKALKEIQAASVTPTVSAK